jgi:hypothetical protein
MVQKPLRRAVTDHAPLAFGSLGGHTEMVVNVAEGGGCSVALGGVHSRALPGLARIRIRLGRTRKGVPAMPGAVAAAEEEDLEGALCRVLRDTPRAFVVVYDFREYEERADLLVRSLARFWGRREAEMGAGSLPKAAAILIGESLFASLGGGLVSTFMKACRIACPLAICHTEGAAEEFFETRLAPGKGPGERGRPPFVSVVNVLDAPSGRVCGCLALLAPLRPQGKAAEEEAHRGTSRAHTFHMQPNGDVRVVQSFHEDVMVSEDLELAHLDKLRSSGSRRCLAGCGSLSSCASPAVAALKFCCAKAQLELLLGVSFHLGELAVDADVEGRSAEKISVAHFSCAQNTGSVWERWERTNDGAECLEGVVALLEQLFSKAALLLGLPRRS